MQTRKSMFILIFLLVLSVLAPSCSSRVSQPLPIDTPKPTSTITHTPTITPIPSFTPLATRTPNLAATQHRAATQTANFASLEEWKLETQHFYDLGYLPTTNGTYRNYQTHVEEWAQLNWYRYDVYEWGAKDFYMSAHFKWSSAYRNADLSGCGFVFAVQDNYDKYSVFLDRNRILFYIYEQSYGYYLPLGLTRGTDRVQFGNPFDQPVEADFTLVVSDAYARVLVDGELMSEYTLSTNKLVEGGYGPAILSGTNKDFGTRCEMTKIHAWIAD